MSTGNDAGNGTSLRSAQGELVGNELRKPLTKVVSRNATYSPAPGATLTESSVNTSPDGDVCEFAAAGARPPGSRAAGSFEATANAAAPELAAAGSGVATGSPGREIELVSAKSSAASSARTASSFVR